jgi:hypothetical protein
MAVPQFRAGGSPLQAHGPMGSRPQPFDVVADENKRPAVVRQRNRRTILTAIPGSLETTGEPFFTLEDGRSPSLRGSFRTSHFEAPAQPPSRASAEEGRMRGLSL